MPRKATGFLLSNPLPIRSVFGIWKEVYRAAWVMAIRPAAVHIAPDFRPGSQAAATDAVVWGDGNSRRRPIMGRNHGVLGPGTSSPFTGPPGVATSSWVRAKSSTGISGT